MTGVAEYAKDNFPALACTLVFSSLEILSGLGRRKRVPRIACLNPRLSLHLAVFGVRASKSWIFIPFPAFLVMARPATFFSYIHTYMLIMRFNGWGSGCVCVATAPS